MAHDAVMAGSTEPVALDRRPAVYAAGTIRTVTVTTISGIATIALAVAVAVSIPVAVSMAVSITVSMAVPVAIAVSMAIPIAGIGLRGTMEWRQRQAADRQSEQRAGDHERSSTVPHSARRAH